MKKKLKNNNFLIPSFLAGMTGLGFGEKVESNNAPSVNISNKKLSQNKRNLSNKKNNDFSKNEEIYDIIKNNLKIEDKFKVDFGYTNGFHKSPINDSFSKSKEINEKNSTENETTVPYVIINPANGPSDKAEYEYIVQIRKNKEMGIKNLGYITTDEYTKSIKKVTFEIDNYIQFYGSNNISGIFIDEISSGTNPLEVDYMAQIYTHIKNKYPDSIVVANPGGTITDEMSKYSDLWLTSEQSADNYINHWTPRTYNFENDPKNANRIVHVIHSAMPEQYETLLKLSKERNAGFIMIATDIPNVPGNLPQNFENLILSVNTPETETASDEKNISNEQLATENTDTELISNNSENPASEEIAENLRIEDKFDLQKFVSSGKYSINGNLKISALDFWNFLNLQCKPDIFLSYFNLRYDILGEFTVKPSEKINEFGDFKFDLNKNWDV